VSETPSLLTSWSFDPLQLAPIAIVGAAYAKRVHTLRGRGTDVPRWRLLLFGLGLALLVVALASPVHAFGDEQFFSFHMLQHVLIGDLAPLCLLAGVSGPILRPVLALPAVERLRVLVHPAVALPLWTANLFIWHIPALYDAALESPALHALEHASFFIAGVALWWPLVEPVPMRRRLSGLGSLAYIGAAKAGLAALGLYLVWSSTVAYPFYEAAPRTWGLSAREDQNVGGAIMMVEQSLVLFGFFVLMFVRMLSHSEEEERRRERLEDAAAA
jgi:putative membrane protein